MKYTCCFYSYLSCPKIPVLFPNGGHGRRANSQCSLPFPVGNFRPILKVSTAISRKKVLAVAGVYRPNANNNAQFILAPTRQLHCRRKGSMAATRS